MRLPGAAALLMISGLIIFSAILIAPIPFQLEPTGEITREEASFAVEYLRSCQEKGVALDVPDAIVERKDSVVPMVLTVWEKGRRVGVKQVVDEPLPEAIARLAKYIVTGRLRSLHSSARIQVDFVIAEGWVPQGGMLFSQAFVEGHHGVSAMVNGTRIYLPPSELIRSRMYGSFRPLPDLDKAFRMGLSDETMDPSFRKQLKTLKLKKGAPTDLRRFLVFTLVEDHDLVPRRLLKGTVERPAPDRAMIEASVLAGARYLKRALGEDGLFRYHYDPLRDRDLSGKYNWPRHAGSAYSLALVGDRMDRPEMVAAAGLALEGFERQLRDGPVGTRCLYAKERCYLGSSALGLLALAEYRIASGDDRYDEASREVAAFLRFMQREDGTFDHEWYPKTGVDRDIMKLYASQQAVLALARHSRAVGDPESLSAAEKGMDYLAGPYWDIFLGSYFFGQEHWSCLAAEELYNHLEKPEYARYCHGIGTHYDNIHHNASDTPYSEDVGGMSITHMYTPITGGSATGVEAMVSAVLLGESEGLNVKEIRRQVIESYGFLVKSQVQVHDTFWMPRPEFAVGAFFETQSVSRVRIDTVQHAICAMVRGLDFLGETSEEARQKAQLNYTLTHQ